MCTYPTPSWSSGRHPTDSHICIHIRLLVDQLLVDQLPANQTLPSSGRTSFHNKRHLSLDVIVECHTFGKECNVSCSRKAYRYEIPLHQKDASGWPNHFDQDQYFTESCRCSHKVSTQGKTSAMHTGGGS